MTPPADNLARHAGDASAPRAVVVGAGPSGFYAAAQLLDAGFEVDMLDARLTPFGLVRVGVAPDHPKIKSVTRIFEKIATRPGFRFFGGVKLGEHVSRVELLRHYHAVLYAFGASDDNRLGVPGEDRPGSHSATDFVAWYNGDPDAADLRFDLSVRRAVVIGNGNVAIDVARMLVLHRRELETTDVADHALTAFADSHVEEVVVLGRRGPAQASFTDPELRELGDLEHVSVDVAPADLELDDYTCGWLDRDASATATRNIEILKSYAHAAPKTSPRRISFRFLRSPIEIVGHGNDGHVTGIRVARCRLTPEGGGVRSVPTGEEELIECGLVLRSVGYRGQPVGDIPFDSARGRIRNENGRVVDDRGRTQRGEYAVGWIKRGPSGVIGTNKLDATETVSRVLEDRDAGALNNASEANHLASAALYALRAPDAVDWAGWQAIDGVERAAGELRGRPRNKLVRVADLVAASVLKPPGRTNDSNLVVNSDSATPKLG